MNTWRIPACMVVAVALAMLPSVVIADTVTLDASKDNTLYESSAGALSNGAGVFFFTGRTGQNSNSIRRGLLAFDIAGSIPSGSTINSVRLVLRMSRATTNAQRTVSLHRAQADWGEGASNAPGQEGSGAPAAPGDATWIHTFSPGSFWASPGGDFVAVPSDSTGVLGVGSYTWGSTAQMVADVQTWLDAPASNFGWLLQGDESVIETAKRFDSRNNLTDANRPKLTIDFTPPVACCFEDGTCQDISADECIAAKGAPRPSGSTCATTFCPPPPQACCRPDGSCIEVDEGLCLELQGEPQGAGTTCTPTTCVPPVPVSTPWGLAAMLALVLSAGVLVARRVRPVEARA